MLRSRSARPKHGKIKSHALAEGLLLAGMVGLAIVTASRILPIEAQSPPEDRAFSPLSSTRSPMP
jgi:hypothetical protein